MKCEQCSQPIQEAEEREMHGLVLCEDCYIDKLTPAKACDPWAVFTAKSCSDKNGHCCFDRKPAKNFKDSFGNRRPVLCRPGNPERFFTI